MKHEAFVFKKRKKWSKGRKEEGSRQEGKKEGREDQIAELFKSCTKNEGNMTEALNLKNSNISSLESNLSSYKTFSKRDIQRKDKDSDGNRGCIFMIEML